jgi:hypothetical protein
MTPRPWGEGGGGGRERVPKTIENCVASFMDDP